MTPSGNLCARSDRSEIDRRVAEYGGAISDTARGAIQLDSLDREWRR